MKMRSTRGWSLALCLATVITAGACAERAPEAVNKALGGPTLVVALPDPGLLPATEPVAPLIPLAGRDGRRDGGTLLLARWAGRRVALVADADAHALRVVDADSHARISHLALGGEPAQLAVAGDGRIWIALRDRSELVSVELSSTRPPHIVQRSETAPEPVALAVSPDGGRVFVTSGWGASLASYRVPSGERRFSIPVDREPRGITISHDGRYAYITHALGAVISKVALPAGEAPLEPAAWPVHETISLASIDFSGGGSMAIQRFPDLRRLEFDFLGDHGLEGEQLNPGFGSRRTPVKGRFAGFGSNRQIARGAAQGFAITALDDDIFAPQVLVHRGAVMVGGYGTSESFEAHQPAIAQLHHEPDAADSATLRVQGRAFAAHSSRQGALSRSSHDDCRLPRAAAVDSVEHTLLVSCLGTNEVRAYSTAAERLVTSGRGRWSVPAGPLGLAIDPQRRQALVWSQFASALTSFDLPALKEGERPPLLHRRKPDVPERMTVLAALPGQQPHLSAAAQRGRELFHAAGDRRIAFDGRACASCHPDGRDDGLTWPTPNGPRQTPMLAGRLDAATAPYGWQGQSASIALHLKQTFQRLGGQGLPADDLEALLAYLHEMSTPKAGPSSATASADIVAKGKQLFHAETVGCATCHTAGGHGSDGARHDVGSGTELETPSLTFVAGTAPYFHDGRYETLSDMLRDTKGTMGWGVDLGPDDLAALEAYLTTL